MTVRLIAGLPVDRFPRLGEDVLLEGGVDVDRAMNVFELESTAYFANSGRFPTFREEKTGYRF